MGQCFSPSEFFPHKAALTGTVSPDARPPCRSIFRRRPDKYMKTARPPAVTEKDAPP